MFARSWSNSPASYPRILLIIRIQRTLLTTSHPAVQLPPSWSSPVTTFPSTRSTVPPFPRVLGPSVRTLRDSQSRTRTRSRSIHCEYVSSRTLSGMLKGALLPRRELGTQIITRDGFERSGDPFDIIPVKSEGDHFELRRFREVD